MDGWDIVLLVVAGYIAVTALVRLMIGQRNRLVDRFRRELRAETKKKQAEQKGSPRPQRERKAA